MKLELTYDEVSTICHALLLKAEEAATGARECAKLGDMDNDVKFWQERAENYKKVYEAVVAQRASWWEEGNGDEQRNDDLPALRGSRQKR